VLQRSAARHAGLVTGVHVGGETGFWSRGDLPAGAHTVFEIGSITKTFTGTLLADMARERLVALDDPVERHLPVAPPVDGRKITLEDLATHSAGLPRLPHGMLRIALTSERKDPYARLDDAGMRAAIAATRPKRAPGGRTAYSNYGMGLLGYALARRAGTSYGELVEQRLTGPLGLTDTALDTPGLAHGHTLLGRPTPPWHLAQIAGAGGLRSTAADLLDWLALHTRTGTPLAAAAAEARRPRTKLGGVRIGLGWMILPAGKGPPWVRLPHDVVMHEGGTGGFRTFAAVMPQTGAAVVVLANQARGTGRLGFQLLRQLFST
jgi:CubicO group peptidase (beta-lactamase class C family)